MKIKYLLIILIVILLLGSGGAYWYYFMGPGAGDVTSNVDNSTTDNSTDTGGFVPLNRPSSTSAPTPTNSTDSSTDSNSLTPEDISTSTTKVAPPKLRMLSSTPVGGYGASTTKTTTIVRWVDRGRGNIYEANGKTLDVATLSNTVVPRIYESAWNLNLTAFLGATLVDGADNFTTVYAELRTQSASTTTPYTLSGKNLPENTVAYALSPKKDKIFLLMKENGSGVGYTANINGQSLVRIFSTPLTQLNVDWPEDNTITLTTKASAKQDGYLYFVNPKTGTWKKVAGPLRGMSAKVSHDAKYALVSSIDDANATLKTDIYNISKNTITASNVKTLTEKCAWGNFYKEVFYCAVSSQLPNGMYPDDWYVGNLSFKDKIWQINATTGEIKLISNIIDQSDRLIDAYKMDLDRNDNFLFFINKTDLTLWSIDLVASR